MVACQWNISSPTGPALRNGQYVEKANYNLPLQIIVILCDYPTINSVNRYECNPLVRQEKGKMRT